MATLTPQQYAAQLLAIAALVMPETKKIVAKGAQNIKTESKQNVQRSAPVHNAHAANAIGYDTTATALAVEAEIGYDKNKRGGALGNILEFGTRHNAGHRDIGRATDNEEPRFVAEMGILGTRLLT